MSKAESLEATAATQPAFRDEGCSHTVAGVASGGMMMSLILILINKDVIQLKNSDRVQQGPVYDQTPKPYFVLQTVACITLIM